jgi:hypothetical protein
MEWDSIRVIEIDRCLISTVTAVCASCGGICVTPSVAGALKTGSNAAQFRVKFFMPLNLKE